MKQLTWHHSWLSLGLLVILFWFPPAGLIALYFAFLSMRQRSLGEWTASRRSTVKMRNMLRIGTFAGLLLFTVLCAYIFIKGGEIVPAIGSFY